MWKAAELEPIQNKGYRGFRGRIITRPFPDEESLRRRLNLIGRNDLFLLEESDTPRGRRRVWHDRVDGVKLVDPVLEVQYVAEA